MATATSRLAYEDCFTVFGQALDDGKGIRIPFPDEGAARHYRTRLHSARALDRADNRETYPHPHPMHGQSLYDSIVCRLRQIDGVWYVYLEQQAVPGKVESLSEEQRS